MGHGYKYTLFYNNPSFIQLITVLQAIVRTRKIRMAYQIVTIIKLFDNETLIQILQENQIRQAK